MMTMPGFKASNADPPTPRTGMEAADAGSDAVEEGTPHGIPDATDLAAREPCGRIVERDEHAPHQLPEHAVREPGLAVLLLDRRRVTEQRGGEDQRPRRVAADAQHDVGVVPAKDARRLDERARQPRQATQETAQTHALEAADRHQLQREAGRRHQARLQAARRADEHRLAAGRGLHFFCDGDTGIEVPARPAARDQQAQGPALVRHRTSVAAVAAAAAAAVRGGVAGRRPRR